jgi:putative glutamine amidotransferase
MSKPLIGITSSRKQRDHDRYDSNVLGDYSRAVSAAGGLPLLIPNETPLADLRELATSLNGILLTGGGDIYSDLYGQADDGFSVNRSRTRDQVEQALVALAVELDLPLLGICRGMQMLNVALGGTLFTDIASQYRTDIVHSQPTANAPGYLVHEATITDGSRLCAIIGVHTLRVNSRHHQAVKALAPELVVTARANDGLIEGIEHPGRRFCVGVQWHPESLLNDDVQLSIFKGFINSTKASLKG